MGTKGLGEVEITSEGETVSSKKHVSLSYSPPKQTIGLRFKLGLNNLSLCANHKTFPSLALYWKDRLSAKNAIQPLAQVLIALHLGGIPVPLVRRVTL